MSDERDVEVAAMDMISSALGTLSEDGARRVLDWARDRFLDEPVRVLRRAQDRALMEELKAVDRKAAELGVTHRELIHAFAALREGQVAPAEIREEIQRTEDGLRATLNGTGESA